jgi:2-(1,2-epoxy-1,2-dihydrophenyl)acetyl-CoA isomerase
MVPRMAEVETGRDGAVLTITLNRPDVLNALDGAMHAQLRAALAEAADPAIRAVVLTGAGRGFCVGQDLAEFSSMDTGDALRERYHPNVLAIRNLEKPVIAAVNGPAAGAGLSLACACDVRIAGESASFVPAFINIGLVPDAGGSFFVHRLLGYARAFEWMTSGHKLSAAEAKDWGLVTAVVPDEELQRHAAELAGRYAHMPTRGIWLTKKLFDHAGTATLEEQLALEARLQSEATKTPDFAEGVAAFREKREPEFTGLPPERHPVELVVADDRVRWRLTAALRLLLALPHVAVLALWQPVALAVALVGWFVALFRGSLPGGVHAFLARFVRYQAHVNAYTWLVAEPFPSFRGWPGAYPIDVEIAGPRVQNRWKTGFRIVLVIPAYVFASVLSTVLQIVGLLAWIVATAVGHVPKGMRDLAAYCIRYQAQTFAYLLLLTDAYPSLASNITATGELRS